MHTLKEKNDEMKIKRYKFSPVWNIDVEESCFFFQCRVKNLTCPNFMNPFYLKLSYSVCTCIALNFKVGLSPSKKRCPICFIECLLKIMKNAFYFIVRALSVLKIFKFLSWIFAQVGKTAWLER